MRILITGGAGYIGYSLVQSLDKNESVTKITVFDNLYKKNFNFFTQGENLNKTIFAKGDILNIYELERVVKNQDIVIHLAAHVDSPFNYQDNYKYEQVNHYGTVVLFNLLEKFPPQKVIFASSAAVYGFKQNVTENTPPEPMNYYGSSKLNAENYLKILEKKSQIYLLRLGNVFGYNPMLRMDSVINKLMMEALIYKKIKIYGNGNQIRPFIHLPSLIENLQQFIFGNKESGVYNLVEFNQNMNEIRDFLIEGNSDLEFVYLNSNQEVKSLEMFSEKMKIKANPAEKLALAYQEFEKNVRIF